MAADWPLGAATACGRSQFMAIWPSSNSTYCGQNRFLAGDHCQWVVVLGRDPELRCRALLQGVDKGERDEELLPDPPDFWRARSEGGCAAETFSPGWSSRTRRGRIMAEFAAGGADHCKISVRIRSLGNKKNRPDLCISLERNHKSGGWISPRHGKRSEILIISRKSASDLTTLQNHKHLRSQTSKTKM